MASASLSWRLAQCSMQPLSLEVTTSQNICLVITPKPHWMRKSDMTRPLRPIRQPMPNIRKTAQSSSTGLLPMIGSKIRQNKTLQTPTTLLKLYNKVHQDQQMKPPKEPEFSDFYTPSAQQKQGELLFVGTGALALGYAAFRFL